MQSWKSGAAWIVGGILAVAGVFWILKPPPVEPVDPPADKPLLLKVRQDFLNGHWKEAFEGLRPIADHRFKEGGLGDDVNKIAHRVTGALNKAKQAGALFDQGQKETAAHLMSEAAHEYPEDKQLQWTADYYEAQVAFDRKDYDLYLRLAEDNMRKNPEGPTTALWLANALATKYAVSGETEFRDRSLEALGKAESLAKSAGAATAELSGAVDRVRYRLKTREILTPEEYAKKVAPRPTP